jgi:hypothetical protein
MDNKETHMKRIMMLVALVVSLAVMGLTSCDVATNGNTAVGKRVLITPEEIALLPTTGAAWTRLSGIANGTWDPHSLADQESFADTQVLAGAIVGIRTNDAALIDKARQHIRVMLAYEAYTGHISGPGGFYFDPTYEDDCPDGRALGIARQIPAYTIAADLVLTAQADRDAYAAMLQRAKTRVVCGHSGGSNSVITVALRSNNNWGSMARAAVLAADYFIGEQSQMAEIEQILHTHLAWAGEKDASVSPAVPYPNNIAWSSTNWHTNTPKSGINQPGATLSGVNVSGVLPEEQRRAGEFSGSVPAESYVWEGLQGAVLSAVLLDRHAAGATYDLQMASVTGSQNVWKAGSNALSRAMTYYTFIGNPAEAEDANSIWMHNTFAGGQVAISPPSSISPAKNFDGADYIYGCSPSTRTYAGDYDYSYKLTAC